VIRVIRCELTRLKNPYTLLGGTGLMALFAVMATTIVLFTATSDSGMAPPGAARVTPAMLEASDGMFAGVQNFVGMLGIVALVIWAGSAASDYSTGLIRLLAQAEPNRIRLLGGKIVALSIFTCVATLVATMAVVAVAPVVAEGTGVSTDAWIQNAVTTVLESYFQLTLAVLLWGVLGLLVGIVTRSTGIAVAVGIGYLLVFEGLLTMVLERGSKWLPGSAFQAIAAGGNADMSFGTALVLAAAYAVVAMAVSAVVVRRRDITA